MKNKKYLLSVAVLCTGFLVQSPVALSAPLYTQSNVLRDDIPGNCAGTALPASKASIIEYPNGKLRYKAVLNNAPDGDYTAYWTCTTVARGCHDSACGFISAGTVHVSGGHGVGSFLLTGNPFPGNYVHFDLIGPKTYTATFAGVPIGASGAPTSTGATQAGDPTQ